MRVFCPRCKTDLVVPDNLAGTQVRCGNLACQHTFTLPTAVKNAAAGASRSMPPSPVAKGNAAQSRTGLTPPTRPPAAGAPPLPETHGAPDFLDGIADDQARPKARDKAAARAVQSLNLTDMFIGKEKEHVFQLLPGEERLDELTIYHQHFFFVQSGVTRVTLTTYRVLCTVTRVFSPVYWLLSVLFPPLIFYYAIRISRNRNVWLPLGSIDSAEKQYRTNWTVFLVTIFAGYIVASLGASAVGSAFGRSSSLHLVVQSILISLLGPVVLVILLSTRMVGIKVFSAANQFYVGWNAGDRVTSLDDDRQLGPANLVFSEAKFDAFLQRVHAEMERAKFSPSRPVSATN
jgi:hypothetical protein